MTGAIPLPPCAFMSCPGTILMYHNNNNNNNNNRCCNSWRQKYDQERSRDDFKIYRPHNRNLAHVECKSKSDASNNRGDRNHFKFTQTVPEQHTGKA